jgi:dienelactone hydrolase
MPHPFAAPEVVLANGCVGRRVAVPSHNPASFEDLLAGRFGEPLVVDAVLFRPAGSQPAPVVTIVPGSGGVVPPMLHHARSLVDAGIAAFVVDPFTPRVVANTIADQSPISFAASTLDVFAAMQALAREPGIDATRQGAMGYSRGGLAVLHAALEPLAAAAIGPSLRLTAVVAGWPWCGYQFAEPDAGSTAIHIVAGTADNWTSITQTRAYHAKLVQRGARATLVEVEGAHHGFGYGVPVRQLPDAFAVLGAPTVTFDADGVMRDPASGKRQPGATDGDVLRWLTPYASRGVTIGAAPGEMQTFVGEFVGRFRGELLG